MMRYLKKFNESNFNFIKASKRKYEMFISEINDILLDLFYSGIQYILSITITFGEHS